MVNNYKVITLCGSTKFKEEFIRQQERLTLDGNIVISVGLFGHVDMPEIMSTEKKTMLDDMHKRKIDISDEIFVIDVGEYIGESTLSEIEYAKSKGKAIHFYSNPGFYDEIGGFHDEAIGWDPDGGWCGECTRDSCKGCSSYKKMEGEKLNEKF